MHFNCGILLMIHKFVTIVTYVTTTKNIKFTNNNISMWKGCKSNIRLFDIKYVDTVD